MSTIYKLIIKNGRINVNNFNIDTNYLDSTAIFDVVKARLGWTVEGCGVTIKNQTKGETLVHIATDDDVSTAVHNRLSEWLAADPFEGPFKAGSLLWFGSNGEACAD